MSEQTQPKKQTKIMSLFQSILLGLVLLIGFGVRVFDIQDPPLDFHATRQLRSYLIARGVFYENNSAFDEITRQRAADLAVLEAYEPPILEHLVGFSYKLIGSEQPWVARVYMATFWTLGGLALFMIARKFSGFYAALLGTCFYLYLPIGVVASRSFQPDPWMVMWILFTAYTLLRWAESRKFKWALITGFCAGIAVIVKAVALFFIAPMVAYVAFFQIGLLKFWKDEQFWVLTLLTTVPTLIYYAFLPSGRTSEFMSFWVGSLSWLVLDTEFYADWLAMIKTLVGLGFFFAAVMGIFLSDSKFKPVLIGAWTGYLLYGLIFPYQYMTHEYYHLPLIALIGLSLAALLDGIFQKLSTQHWVWRIGAAALLVFVCFYNFYVARSTLVAADYKFEPYSWQLVGESIPEESDFIMLTADYGMRLRYYGWRIGRSWPSGADLNLKALGSEEEYNFEAYFSELAEGLDYFLITSFSELDAQPELRDHLQQYCAVYKEGNGFLVYDLKNPPETAKSE